MNNIKTEFTIKDLESFSGIKAHTIRIWEKRYNLLEPNRTDSNIRYYDILNLQKLLNVSLLNNHGIKISKIADLSDSQILANVREVISKNGVESQSSNMLKLAMLNFDEALFVKTYNGLLTKLSFREIVKKVFLPFLNEIGMLWQISSITPAHEHFITNLIKQKFYTNIESVQLSEPSSNSRLFALYLPLNEIHELGLLYLHYELLLHGYKSIYLGQSVPISNLADVLKVHETCCFVSFLTVEPSKITVDEYIDAVSNEVLNSSNSELWLLGLKSSEASKSKLNSNIKVFSKIDDLIKLL
ncbi:MerR family transcriptional regulator [Lutibacter sp. HS1-25]|uniref:MerR family transcriptional regulator n=1 Tax=Lutibacter sp. HS1-25 TaxID=2485000 RepID=UPI001012979D|nr:MerR family transcriptional regulator [Lutibacter sp. HS1-25]RXP61933.1 MerR family transcriptional regulator [Lutibacter sp. HS1-25]